MKKLLIAAVMCLLVSLNVLAEEPEKYKFGDYEYTLLDDGTVEIIHFFSENEEIAVPEQIEGYEVTSIGDYACSFCENLERVKLPDSINNLGDNPFRAWDISILISPDHPYLATIDGVLFSKPDKRLIYYPDTKESYVVPEGIEIVGDGAFYFCRRLNSITLPDTVTRIGSFAFFECDSLSSITLSENITSIGDGAFGECEELESINLPESINDVGANPFSKCENIKFNVSKDHPYLAVIDGVLFSKSDKRLVYCPNTKDNYVVPDGIQTIGASAFSSCDGLTSITLPDSVTSIGTNAFYNCENLSSITLPENITSIGSAAFGDCISLRSINLPDSVSRIGLAAFGRCKNLTITVSRDSYAATYCEKNGLSYTYPDANDWLNN